MNRGIEAARTDWVAILNNDVTLEPDWLRVCSKPHRGRARVCQREKFCGPSSGIIDGTFDEISRGACACRCGSGKPDGPGGMNRAASASPLTAAVPPRPLSRVGTLDESFGSYLKTSILAPVRAGRPRRGIRAGRRRPSSGQRYSRGVAQTQCARSPATRFCWPPSTSAGDRVSRSWRASALGLDGPPPWAWLVLSARENRRISRGSPYFRTAGEWPSSRPFSKLVSRRSLKFSGTWLRCLLEGLLLAAAAIIVTYNSADVIVSCLDAVSDGALVDSGGAITPPPMTRSSAFAPDGSTSDRQPRQSWVRRRRESRRARSRPGRLLLLLNPGLHGDASG